MRVAKCSCEQLQIRLRGTLLGVGLCHCLACQKRTGSAFATLASFEGPFEVTGRASRFAREGDHGASLSYSFCPACGTHLFHQEDGRPDFVGVSVGAFADPEFPAPEVSIHELRRHRWVAPPKGAARFQSDPA